MDYHLKQAEVRVYVRESPGIYWKQQFDSPEIVADALREEMSQLDRENVWAVNLDVKNHAINYSVVSVGGTNYSVVDVPNVFKTAILSNATRILLAHNHPSGDPTPSADDLEITKRLCKAGKILGIELVDHVILTDNRVYSIRLNHSDMF